MPNIAARFMGVELYFEDLERAKEFNVETAPNAGEPKVPSQFHGPICPTPLPTKS